MDRDHARHERAGAKWLSSEEREQGQRTKQIVLATLPPATYPRLVECAIAMTSCADPEFHYELGVSLFVAGVEAIAARQAGKPSVTEKRS